MTAPLRIFILKIVNYDPVLSIVDDQLSIVVVILYDVVICELCSIMAHALFR